MANFQFFMPFSTRDGKERKLFYVAGKVTVSASPGQEIEIISTLYTKVLSRRLFTAEVRAARGRPCGICGG
jgi:hypothetical protein